jgi:divalent metal cation (Fe/Co/Zn/Cd) transporter
LQARKVELDYFVDIHVQADETMPLVEAHNISGKVNGVIRTAVFEVAGVLIHLEPFAEKCSDATSECNG